MPNVQDQITGVSSQEKYDNLIKAVTQISVETGKWGAALTNVDKSTRDVIAKLIKAKKSEEEIKKILEIRIQKEYELADKRKKNEMIYQGYINQQN